MSRRHNPPSGARCVPVLSVLLTAEQDIVTARQRAREIAEFAGFDHQNQIRIATAVSEIARNAVQYASSGRCDYVIQFQPERALRIDITDKGPGIPNLKHVLSGDYQSRSGMGLGLIGARRLMDGCEIESEPGKGTSVRLVRLLPPDSPLRAPADVVVLADRLAAAKPASAIEELNHNTTELVRALEELREREVDLRRLNQELEETNRGVVALYTELEEHALSLRRATELKSRFLSHISHEFRTPLNSILALSRLLASHADGQLSPEQDKQIGYVQRAAQELSDMVNDLLDLAKVEAGKTEVYEAEFPVASLFGTLRGLMRPLQTNPNVELIIEDPADLILRTDETKVAQILRNLVSNALKFTETGEVRARVLVAAEKVLFTVSDTGIGIAPEDQPRVFQEFTQLEHTLQRKVKGTGLGLPLSRKLAELLGGSLDVQSELGRGSTFTLELPARVMVSGGAVPERGPGPQPLRLLVIDDDEVSRYVIQQVLRDTEVAVIEADSGSTGLDRARFERPDVVLLDITMPGMSGFEVLEQLRNDHETETVPVVIYTSRSLPAGDKEKLKEAGAAILPKKDLDQRRLLSAISDALQIFGRSFAPRGVYHVSS